MPYGLEMAWGQNNRWTYCANDPVNLTDPTGEGPGVSALSPFGLAFTVGAFWGGAYAAWALGDLSLAANGGRFSLNALFASAAFRRWLANLVISLYGKPTCTYDAMNGVGLWSPSASAQALGVAALGGFSFGAVTYTMWSLFDSGAAWVG